MSNPAPPNARRMTPEEHLEVALEEQRQWQLAARLLESQANGHHQMSHYYEFRAEISGPLSYSNLFQAQLSAERIFRQFAEEARTQLKDWKAIEKRIRRELHETDNTDVIDGLRILRDAAS